MLEELRKEKRERKLLEEKKKKKKGLSFLGKWKKSREEATLERERRRKQILAEKERKGRELKLKIEGLKQERDRERREMLSGVEEEREIQKAIRAVKRKGVWFNLKNIFKRRPKEEFPVKEIPEIRVEALKKEMALPKAYKPRREKRFNELGFIKHRIYDARDALTELDLQRARHIYVEIMASYKELKEKDRAKIYYDIKGLYDDRKHAEAMFEKR